MGNSKKSKYHAVRIGGYDSMKERRRAVVLRLMERQGLIKDLREQVSFELIPAQYGNCGKDLKGKSVTICLEKACKYIADFVYIDAATGQTVVEDVKGVRTDVYKIKKKLMLYMHGIIIKET